MSIKNFLKWRFHPVKILIGIIVVVVLAFIFGALVLVLWNWLMPDIFGLKTITYWQAWGLVLLSHILLKAGRGKHHFPAHHLHGHEWKKKLRERMEKFHGKDFCNGRDFHDHDHEEEQKE